MTQRATRSLPPSSHTPRPYEGPARDEVLAMRREYLTPGLITYYRDPVLIVEGHMQYLWDDAGRAVSRRLRRDRQRVGRPLPPQHRREGPRAGRDAPARDDDLPPPDGGPVREEAGRAHARGQRPVGQLFHQLGERGERGRRPDGAGAHRQFRDHRPPQRLPRRDPGCDGADRPRHLEVPEQPRRSGSSTPRPATATVARSDWTYPELRIEVRPRRRGCDPVRDSGRGRRLHRRADPGGRRGGDAAAESTSRSSTRSSASTAGSASPTRCRPASAAPASISGDSRTGASCPTS